MTNKNGRFGIHGGQYIPETLMNAVIELEEAYNYYKNDPAFNRELTELFNEYAGRPSRLYYAEKMCRFCGQHENSLCKCGKTIRLRPLLPLFCIRQTAAENTNEL